jgi:hypothetical protein
MINRDRRPISFRAWMRVHPTWTVAIGALLIVGALIVATEPIDAQIRSSAPVQGKGPHPGPRVDGPANPYVPLPAKSATVCGAWSSAASATGQRITQQYGEIRNCLAVESTRSTWVITTLGTGAASGVLGVYRCRSEQCRDGSTDHPIAGWTFYRGPYGGGVTVMRVESATTLIVDNAGHQLTFDLNAGVFS